MIKRLAWTVALWALLLGCPMCVHANPGKWAQKVWKAGASMVVGCLQGMRLADKDIVRHSFLDKMFLEPGKRYEPEIYDYIDNKADVFLLFWSKNAAASEWVKKEYTRALQRQKRDARPAVRRPEIIPVPLESPIPPPPAELSDIHFGDVFVALKGGGNGMA